MFQPVDQNCGVDIKRRVGEKLNVRLSEDDAFQKLWLGVDGTFPARERRILLTKLVGEAWEEFCAEKNFFALGLSTGCVMPRIGVNRKNGAIGSHPIRIPNIENYGFEQVPLGEPIPQLEGEDHDVMREDDAENAANILSVQSASHTAAAASAEASSTDDVDDINLFSIGAAVADENEEIVEDFEGADALLDDTSDVSPPGCPLDCPEGYAFEDRPSELPAVSSWQGREIYWRAELPNGDELVWIKTELIGGPADPRQAFQGVTMRLKCDKRRDPRTPACYRSKHSCVVQVALSVENYGAKWFLLRKL